MFSPHTSGEDVLFDQVGDKFVLTLNRPKALNALDLSMIKKINPLLKKWHEEKNVKMIIIKGSGEKAFCAGGDIRAVSGAKSVQNNIQQDFFKEEYKLNYGIGTSKIPWVALIDGITMGGGVGVSVHGHFRVATERTLFAMPETAIGLIPDVGGGYFLPRLPNHIGTFLALTGFRLKGRNVFTAGIATHFVEHAKIKDLERDLLNVKDANLLNTKEVLNYYHDRCSIEKDKPYILAEHLGLIKHAFSDYDISGIVQKLKNDSSDWCNTQLQTLNKMSPTSLKVTCEQLRHGSTKDLRDVLVMEYRIVQRIMQGSDFYEGVRSVIIDKDMKPVWNPKTLDEVSDEFVQSHFEPFKDGDDIHLEPF
ncbi:hypothetical protein HELRODRAFT_66323 [Helobdella robusta]|uniref:3-hydroxyisobutyryl-CoA hydrolase, mitochondrial n=1 Tax=Helobdella robusta TaxID=6412 RepID=T1FYJ8_HELRO|nr:hypothetical protein HELRODRAFT_66323 [Helobdella robusta]ESO02700.1 hypothetical protein HELRODRAFT_66323 [Helobdella robusta]